MKELIQHPQLITNSGAIFSILIIVFFAGKVWIPKLIDTFREESKSNREVFENTNKRLEERFHQESSLNRELLMQTIDKFNQHYSRTNDQ